MPTPDLVDFKTFFLNLSHVVKKSARVRDVRFGFINKIERFKYLVSSCANRIVDDVQLVELDAAGWYSEKRQEYFAIKNIVKVTTEIL